MRGPREPEGAGALRVLWCDGRDWAAVEKPAGVLTTGPTKGGPSALDERVRTHFASKFAHAHALSRLDVDVSGVVLFALSEGAVRAADRAKREGLYARTYVALLARTPEPREGTWEWPVGTDPRDAHRRLAGAGLDPRDALTRYRVEMQGEEGVARVEFTPETGRTHQLRVHAAHARCPMLGDALYGGPRRVVRASGEVLSVPRVLLHALRVRVPVSDEGATVVECAPPEDFARVERALFSGAPRSDLR